LTGEGGWLIPEIVSQKEVEMGGKRFQAGGIFRRTGEVAGVAAAIILLVSMVTFTPVNIFSLVVLAALIGGGTWFFSCQATRR
jgi:hypothetical protein